MCPSHNKQISAYQSILENCTKNNRTSNYHSVFLLQEEVTGLAGRNMLEQQIAVPFFPHLLTAVKAIALGSRRPAVTASSNHLRNYTHMKETFVNNIRLLQEEKCFEVSYS